MTLRADLSGYSTKSDGIMAMLHCVGEINDRLSKLGAELFTVKPSGADGIQIEVAGKMTVVDVRKALFTKGDVRLCWANNLDTNFQTQRPYHEEKLGSVEKGITFTKRKDAAEITFGDPAYAKIVSDWYTILEAKDFDKASPDNVNGKWVPSMRFTADGGRKIRAWCLANAAKGEKIAVVVDGKVLNVAALQAGAVIDRNAIIQGIDGTDAEVRKICEAINSKPLSLKLTEEEAKEFPP